MASLSVCLLVLAVVCVPVVTGYSDGARSESCYKMQVEHQSEFDIRPRAAIDCLSLGTGCPYTLEVVAMVDNEINQTSAELFSGSGMGGVNITTYECGQCYEGQITSGGRMDTPAQVE